MKLGELIEKVTIPSKPVRVIIPVNGKHKALFFLGTTADGSLMVDPSIGCSFDNWRYSFCTVPRGKVQNISVPLDQKSMIESGKIGPKITYHKSGFVKVGKTKLLEPVSIWATPLDIAFGHLFTYQAKGFQGFNSVTTPNPKYSDIMPIIPAGLKTLKIVAHAGKLEHLIPTMDQVNISTLSRPNRIFEKDNGNLTEISLFKISIASRDIWIKLTYIPNFILTQNPQPSINSLIGWDQDKADDLRKPLKFVAIAAGGDW